jgi:hypothetical protein
MISIGITWHGEHGVNIIRIRCNQTCSSGPDADPCQLHLALQCTFITIIIHVSSPKIILERIFELGEFQTLTPATSVKAWVRSLWSADVCFSSNFAGFQTPGGFVAHGRCSS